MLVVQNSETITTSHVFIVNIILMMRLTVVTSKWRSQLQLPQENMYTKLRSLLRPYVL